jgi:hypothetical protein
MENQRAIGFDLVASVFLVILVMASALDWVDMVSDCLD